MWGVLGKVLQRRGLSRGSGNGLGAADRAALIEGVLAEADAIGGRNADLARQLRARLAGNAGTVALADAPDGLGCFYGHYIDGDGRRFRLDVLPPAPLWCGEGGTAADPHCWVVHLDGIEVAKAPSIGELPALGSVLTRS